MRIVQQQVQRSAELETVGVAVRLTSDEVHALQSDADAAQFMYG